MKSTLVCIHGNPGHPDNFSEILKSPQFSNDHILFFGAEEVSSTTLEEQFDELEELLKPVDGPCDFLCYSWGSYVCVKFLLDRGVKARNVILLNPTLYARNGFSALVTILSQTPLVNRIMFSSLANSLANSFIRKSFAPNVADPNLSKKLTADLQSPALWLDAISKKNEMAANPLEDITNIAENILVIYGSEDRSVPWPSQSPMVQELQKLNHLEICEVKGAGHSLLWTHQAEVLEILKKHRGGNHGQGTS